MLRDMPRSGSEPHAVACPIVQASPDILQHDLGAKPERLLSPLLDFGEDDLDSVELMQSCRRVAALLGKSGWWPAFERARQAQSVFRAECRRIGERALRFCEQHDVVAGRGARAAVHHLQFGSELQRAAAAARAGGDAIPVDCYPVSTPCRPSTACTGGTASATCAPRTRSVAAPASTRIWCSNYSCGPDSFNLHFFCSRHGRASRSR